MVQVMIQNLFFEKEVGGGGGGGGECSLTPPMLNIFTVGNMGVMICISQGGLHSMSASVCLSVDNITQKLWTDWEEILWRGPG